MFEIHGEDLGVKEHIMFGIIEMYTDMDCYDVTIS